MPAQAFQNRLPVALVGRLFDAVHPMLPIAGNDYPMPAACYSYRHRQAAHRHILQDLIALALQAAEKLVKEAARLGFKTVLLPARNLEKLPAKPEGIRLVGVRTLAEAITASSQISQNKAIK